MSKPDDFFSADLFCKELPPSGEWLQVIPMGKPVDWIKDEKFVPWPMTLRLRDNDKPLTFIAYVIARQVAPGTFPVIAAYATHDEAENAPGRLTQVQRVELVAEV